MKRRFVVPFLAALCILIPLTAMAQEIASPIGWKTISTWRNVWMRGTSAAAVARQPNWAFGGFAGGSTVGFVDSTVFRRIVATGTAYDTSVAFPREQFPFPPNIGNLSGVARGDTLLPWIVLRVRQDTTSYSWTGAVALDSVRVGVEYSYDGIDWYSTGGTNTYRFDTVFLTSGQDGLQGTTLVGVEASPGEDAVVIPLKCAQSVTPAGNTYTTNLTSCLAGNYIRFIVGMGGDAGASGQYRLEYQSWKEQ